MTSSQAHKLLSEARAGGDISVATINRCLLATGDLAGINRFAARRDGSADTAHDLHGRLLRAARRMLEASGRGNVKDEHAIQWAETLLRQNVQPRRHVDAGDELPEGLWG